MLDLLDAASPLPFCACGSGLSFRGFVRAIVQEEEISYRRVLGEDSVIEVELIIVDADDAEGPLGAPGLGRSGISSTRSDASGGFGTPLSYRSSIHSQARVSRLRNLRLLAIRKRCLLTDHVWLQLSVASSSFGRRRHLGRYRVLHPTKYRAGSDMESEELGTLTEVRVCFCRLLELVSPQQQLVSPPQLASPQPAAAGDVWARFDSLRADAGLGDQSLGEADDGERADARAVHSIQGGREVQRVVLVEGEER